VVQCRAELTLSRTRSALCPGALEQSPAGLANFPAVLARERAGAARYCRAVWAPLAEQARLRGGSAGCPVASAGCPADLAQQEMRALFHPALQPAAAQAGLRHLPQRAVRPLHSGRLQPPRRTTARTIKSVSPWAS